MPRDAWHPETSSVDDGQRCGSTVEDGRYADGAAEAVGCATQETGSGGEAPFTACNWF